MRLLLALALAGTALAHWPTPPDFSSAEGPVKKSYYLPLSMRAGNPEGDGPSIAAYSPVTYRGGPIVQKVNVVPIFWKSTVVSLAYIKTYYAALVKTNAYYNLLKQYKTTTPVQTISDGTVAVGYTMPAAPASSTVTDATIRTELNKLFAGGMVPLPNANNYYPIHFPPSVRIQDGSDLSCTNFCAYHGAYKYNNVPVYYGVIPDMTTLGCQMCSNMGTAAALNSCISHELAEVITDPAVGATAKLGWYNDVYGEIGDYGCYQDVRAVLGDGAQHWVQTLWSNSKNTCALN